MSGGISYYNPATRTFGSKRPDGKWAPKGPQQIIQRGQQGAVPNSPAPRPGPEVLKAVK